MLWGKKKKHLSPICGEHFGRVGVRVGCALSKSGLSSRVSCLNKRMVFDDIVSGQRGSDRAIWLSKCERFGRTSLDISFGSKRKSRRLKRLQSSALFSSQINRLFRPTLFFI